MTTWPTQHLTADDLDSFHSGALPADVRFHLETCEPCRQLLAADGELVRQLEAMESIAPSAGFADRVMAHVVVAPAEAVPVLSFPRMTPRRIAAIGAVAAGVVASVTWSAANRSQLDLVLGTVGAGALDAAWTGVRTLAAFLGDQPWFDAVRSAWLAPARLAAGLAAGLAIYISGLVALRRLVTPSASPVSRASA